jgi:hypothetical protein
MRRRYASHWRCGRLFLSDYTSCIAFDINLDDLANRQDREIRLGHAICSYRDHKTAHSVYDYGPKLAVAYEAVEALCDLGMVDEQVCFLFFVQTFPSVSFVPSLTLSPNRRTGEIQL